MCVLSLVSIPLSDEMWIWTCSLTVVYSLPYCSIFVHFDWRFEFVIFILPPWYKWWQTWIPALSELSSCGCGSIHWHYKTISRRPFWPIYHFLLLFFSCFEVIDSEKIKGTFLKSNVVKKISLSACVCYLQKWGLF